MFQNSYRHAHTHITPDGLADRIVHAINSFVCPVRVLFGRMDKIKLVLEGVLVKCTLNETKRKGGGFIFWISYRSQLVPHKIALKWMLDDYCAYIENRRRVPNCKLKPVKNMTVNASKDILIAPEGHIPVPLSTVVPCAIRDMKNPSECIHWISKVSSEGLGAWFTGYSVTVSESNSHQMNCVLDGDVYSVCFSPTQVNEWIDQLRA